MVVSLKLARTREYQEPTNQHTHRVPIHSEFRGTYTQASHKTKMFFVSHHRLIFILITFWTNQSLTIWCDLLLSTKYFRVWGPCRLFYFRANIPKPIQFHKQKIILHFPWNVDVFSNGKIKYHPSSNPTSNTNNYYIRTSHEVSTKMDVLGQSWFISPRQYSQNNLCLQVILYATFLRL